MDIFTLVFLRISSNIFKLFIHIYSYVMSHMFPMRNKYYFQFCTHDHLLSIIIFDEEMNVTSDSCSLVISFKAITLLAPTSELS